MYLKRLDLQGFKSFAARTSFEFGHGMTAIVGPNGSGKSNIADALRWVLGEQSGRLLRAKKLDDIIYAGSTKRQPSDKAEVTITLDNSDGWLPIESREVAITRRGYRSGESEYLINRKRVRLKDIQNMLVQANAGQNSYAIIGQGLVETVLNLRPEDRRQLIEEAADIQRYRLKIEEAQSKVTSTHENVERVNLLVKEIGPRMAQMERQAKRAAEHARLTQQLGVLLRAYYGHQWHHANESLIVSRANHDQAQAEFLRSKVALETVQRELNDMTAQLEEHRRAAAANKAERDRLEQRLRDVDKRLAVVNDRRAILNARQKELRDELTAIATERDRILSTEKSGETRRESLERQAIDARKALEVRQSEMSSLEGEFREARARAAEAEARSKRLQKAAAETRVRIQRLAHTRSDLEREASRLDTRRRSLISQMVEQLRVLRDYRAQQDKLGAEVSLTGANRDVLEQQIADYRQALSKLEATQNARRGKLEALEARLEVLSKARDQVRKAQAEDGVTVEGALATIFEIIRVPQNLENAIAAALADQLDAFIFERQAEAVAAVQSLIAQGGARSTFLPMDSMKQVYPLNLIKEKGVIGVASKLIKYPAHYDKLINALLGRTIVVQDSATAVRILKRGLGNVVTLDGIAFHASGSMTGGQVVGSRPFVLEYERDLESLPKEIEKVRRSLGITEREVESLRERLRASESHLSGLNREAESSLQRRLKLQDALSQRQQRLAQLKGEMRGLVGSQMGMRQQEASLLDEMQRLEDEAQSLLAEAKQDEEAGQFLEKANSIVYQQREAILKTVSEASAEVSRIEGELHSLSVQKEAGQATLARLEAQASAKAVQQQGLEMEVTALESNTRADREEAAEARRHLEAFIERSGPGPESAHHLESRQGDLHSQVLAAQSRLFESERRVLEADAEVRRWQTEVETLRARISEDGLTLTLEGEVLAAAQEDQTKASIPEWLLAEGQDDGRGGLRPMSGGATVNPEALGKEIERLRAQIRALGPVNIEAQTDFEQMKERYDFLTGQLNDLDGAEKSLHRAIEELNKLMHRRFQSTFAQVAAGFEQNFNAFFGGGEAKLVQVNAHDHESAGVEVHARPPGKRTHSLSQLSGGEKALTAMSLLFALLQVNPSPFCVLDEVDAMLDEANVVRFVSALKELAQKTQFIVITHNRRTIEVANSIYGVSMGPDAASRLLSLRLADVSEN